MVNRVLIFWTGWVHAATVDELKILFEIQPPAFQTIQTKAPAYVPPASTSEKIGYNVGKSIRTVIFLIVAAFGIYFLYAQVNTGRSSTYSLHQSSKTQSTQTPRSI